MIEYMMAKPEWHCRIGKLKIKPGVSIFFPFACGNFF